MAAAPHEPQPEYFGLGRRFGREREARAHAPKIFGEGLREKQNFAGEKKGKKLPLLPVCLERLLLTVYNILALEIR